MRNLLLRLKKHLAPKPRKIAHRTLATVSAEEILRERIRTEHTENRISREIEKLEQDKQDWFSRGVAAASDRQKLFFARKVQELDQQVRARDQQLTLVSRNLKVLASLAQLKDNQRVLETLGMEQLVGKLDLTELASYVEQASVSGQLQMDHLAEILTSLNSAEAAFCTGSEDAETLAVFEAMQQASSTAVRSALTHPELTPAATALAGTAA
ncbi:MAG: hypothetical protein ACKO3T_23425 [Planctomycetaceae bacterium]